MMGHKDGPDGTTTHPKDGKISDSCVYAHHMVSSVKVGISLVELGPSRGLISAGV
jgi:hypothetical protein